MRVLVTGGKGVVGTNLVKRLETNGHQVWVCDLKHSHDNNYYRCDIGNYRQLLSLFKRQSFDYVYHLAAEFGRWNGEAYYENLWQTNAIGTKNLLSLQADYGFKMIYTSSSEVYGDYDGIMAEEVMEKLEIKQLNDYAISKWVNELQINNARHTSGNQIMTVRLFNTYGPGEYYTPFRSAVCVFCYKALHNQPYTVFLNHTRSSLFIDDCTYALSALIPGFQDGATYNLAGCEVHSMKDVSDMILSYLGMDDSLVQYMDEEPFTTKNKVADTSSARNAIGFSPRVKLKEGIPLTIEWMKKVYR
ncbi:MAG: NAD(P)-dependent oxidoreductase [Syntrophomonadaceae bacterium]